MNEKPLFTDNELYLIEREFDRVYSSLEREHTKIMELFFALKINKEKDEIVQSVFDRNMRLMDAYTEARRISEKIQRWREAQR